MRISPWSVAILAVVGGCDFSYPANVATVSGTVTGLWSGGQISLRLTAGQIVEDLAVNASDPFTFAASLVAGTSYTVVIADDGPDHDCTISNGSGRVGEDDVHDLMVTCVSLIPHGITISTAVDFAFDPGIAHYDLPVSLLQQEVSVVVSGPTLSTISVAGQRVAEGVPSGPVPLGHGATTVAVELTKGALSRRYELVFDRGAVPIEEALYARAFNAERTDAFGSAIASTRDYVAVGAQAEDSSNIDGADNAMGESGGVYMYRRSGPTWARSQFLKGSPVAAGRAFGSSLAMDEDVLVVGAYTETTAASLSGAVYVFRLDRANGSWMQEQRITPSDGRVSDQFGYAVGASAGVVVVGSPRHDLAAGSGDHVGAVYSFRFDGQFWVQEPILRPAMSLAQGEFGSRVVLSGQRMAVHQNGSGRVFVYRRDGTTWTQENLPATAVGASIALDGDTLVIGQPSEAPSGAIRIFTLAGATWAESGLVRPSNPPANLIVGENVALHGNVMMDVDSITRGPLLFEKVGSSWVQAPTVAVSQTSTGTTFPVGAVTINGYGAAIASSADGGPIPFLPRSGTAWLFR